ncbi:Ribosomal RNA small subunit methyltransferase C [Jannaschia seosinensis]|uniref:Ribosomal RNA small subunit methyltransferase C n=1 Tax=Jannaschia seosinensis TaxID=313367 RepID=A0A0M7B8R1_9RHOB|nr:methyltransferase [Jannaschia seosinensis]CUH37552.1 Ribosomal RNA small subunit methyltransferase C [Jannaschia seosinensis]
MRSRLSHALAAGAVALPSGPVLLLRPPADLDLDGLPEDLTAVQGFRPDHDALASRGLRMADAAEGDFAAAIVFATRAKEQTRDLIARACAHVPPGAPVVVEGAKGDGIDSVLRQCRGIFDVGEVFAKAHGKVFAFPAADPPADWRAAPRVVDGFVTRPGVFSADGADPGSALLAQHVGGLSGRICDLGAGWGFLSHAVLASAAVTECALVEAERDALDCARTNVTDPRATFHWADATAWAADPFDVVVSNPPFHTSRRADPALGWAFLAAAARLLKPKGRLLLVANRHLPYEATLSEHFASAMVLAETGGYKVIDARNPRRSRT